MAELTIPAALPLAVLHHQAGRLPEAEAIYREILARDPQCADALHLLGVIAHQDGQHERALELIGRAAVLAPNHPIIHSNLGEVYRHLGRLEEAVACLKKTLELQPAAANAHYNLGNLLRDQGCLDDAIACYRQALALQPRFAESCNNLGEVLKIRGRLDEALACYHQALALNPRLVEAHNNLGDLLRERGQLDNAAACFQQALALKPDFFPAHHNLGVIFRNRGRLDEAIACFQQALALKPDLTDAHLHLGNLFKERSRPDDAVACFQRAVALQPKLAEAHNNLGNVLRDQGRLDEALDHYRQALSLKPDLLTANANLLFLLPFHPAYDAGSIFAAHREWAARRAAPLARLGPPHDNDRNPDRRLRIGYVSPNFYNHVVGRNLLPLFQHHLREQFEVFCYADVASPDTITDQLRADVHTWRETTGLSDDQLAHLVQEDRIDILVDLTLHMAGSRLLAFARKPAPVQVTFAGYPGTTGLPAIDYRLTDPYLDPPGLLDAHYSETSIRLPDSFWCYATSGDEPAVRPLPATVRGCVTFGCLNQFAKVNPAMLRLWARVLRAVDQSRLLLLAVAGTHRQDTLDVLAAEGISSHRVEFSAPLPRLRYLELYHEIDVGLDTLPYNGHTTSLDSCWMGAPVVTIIGQTVVGRAGWSQLSNLRLTELAAHTPDEFVRIATDLAHDLPRLATLRATLRERMQRSPLTDAPRFARNIEAAYRMMWHRWCASSAPAR